MNILAFDCVLNNLYISFEQDGKIINDIIKSDSRNYHSVYLIPKIIDILKKNNIECLEQIDLIATDIGPGSFTGIRVGLTVGRVLAQQLNRPLVAINSLEILSKIAKQKNNLNKTIVIMDARRDSGYFAVYQNNIEIIKPQINTLFNIRSIIQEQNIETIICSSTIGSNFNNPEIFDDLAHCEEPISIYLVDIAKEKFQNSKDKSKFHFAKAKPLYIQNASVTLKKSK